MNIKVKRSKFAFFQKKSQIFKGPSMLKRSNVFFLFGHVHDRASNKLSAVQKITKMHALHGKTVTMVPTCLIKSAIRALKAL